jgi:predicted ribosomally synthesized peptide with SipW-like signal peptide
MPPHIFRRYIMKKERSVKQRLVSSILAFAMCLTSFLGTTLAWFTDEVTSAGNTIQSGSLKVDLSHKVDDQWISLKENSDHLVFDYDKWEPGYTGVESLKVDNLGSLALQYRLSIEVQSETASPEKNLADVIEVYVAYGDQTATDYATIKATWTHKGTLAEVLANPASFISGELLPAGEELDAGTAETTKVGSAIVSIALHMHEDAGNDYQGLTAGNIFVNLIATQWSYENDAFDSDYDKDSIFPVINVDDIVLEATVENGVTTTSLSAKRADVATYIPAGVAVDEAFVENGKAKLVVSVNEMAQSGANLTLQEGEAIKSLDVHVYGVAANNQVPIIITIDNAMAPGLNIGNYTLYHVENGVSNAMTAVSSEAEITSHNDFYYDPTTGNVSVAMASFSEVALVADTKNKWEGNFDYNWYDASKTELAIANADQLAAFGAIVGGMKMVTDRVDGKYTYSDEVIQDSFAGKTVKLLADINLDDDEANNNENIIFYPIGYWNEDGTYEKSNKAISSGF